MKNIKEPLKSVVAFWAIFLSVLLIFWLFFKGMRLFNPYANINIHAEKATDIYEMSAEAANFDFESFTASLSAPDSITIQGARLMVFAKGEDGRNIPMTGEYDIHIGKFEESHCMVLLMSEGDAIEGLDVNSFVNKNLPIRQGKISVTTGETTVNSGVNENNAVLKYENSGYSLRPITKIALSDAPLWSVRTLSDAVFITKPDNSNFTEEDGIDEEGVNKLYVNGFFMIIGTSQKSGLDLTGDDIEISVSGIVAQDVVGAMANVKRIDARVTGELNFSYRLSPDNSQLARQHIVVIPADGLDASFEGTGTEFSFEYSGTVATARVSEQDLYPDLMSWYRKGDYSVPIAFICAVTGLFVAYKGIDNHKKETAH